jgi:hypothetical protein
MSVLRGLIVVVVAATIVSGCSTTLGQHQPSLDSVQTLRDSGIVPLNVGDFGIASGADPSIDRGVSMRGAPIKPQNGTSFIQYLKDSLIADLRSAGKLDPSSAVTVRADLTDNQLHGLGASTANATLAARFWVTKGDRTVYDKKLEETHSWPSSFIGAIAFPEAVNQYTELYSALLMKLYTDPEFRSACRSP